MLLSLIELTITHHNLNETFSLGILCKEVLAADTETIEATTQRQGFKSPTVNLTKIDTLNEIKNIFVGPILFTLINDCLSNTVSHTLDGCQTKTDFSLLVHTEFLERLVNIRSQRSNTHCLALIHQLRDFSNLITTS